MAHSVQRERMVTGSAVDNIVGGAGNNGRLKLHVSLKAALLALCLTLLWGPLVSRTLGTPMVPGMPFVPVAQAQQAERSVRALRYDVDLTVQPGGDVLVRETQEIAFQGGPFQKASRQLPLRRLEGIQDVRVEEPGQPYRSGYETPFSYAVNGTASGGVGQGSAGEMLVEWWFPQTGNARRTFVLSYRAVGAVRFYPGGDQLRWAALGDDRRYSVDESTVTLRLPVEVPSGGWKVDAYPARLISQSGTGASGDAATWRASDIPAGELYEVRAQWPHGLVAGSPAAWQAAADAEDWRNENLRPVLNLAFGFAGVFIPLLGALGVLLLWFTRGRDPAVGSVPPELDAPPSDLPPAVAGTVVDEHADVQDVIATVLDLAARGILSIQETRDPELAGSQRDFEMTLLQSEAAGLRPYERTVLDSFFSHGNPVRLSRLGAWFHESIPLLQQALHREAAQAGFFVDDPEAVRRRYQRIGTLLIVAGLALGAVACSAAGAYADAVWWPFLGLALTGGMVRFAGRRMPKRTSAGALEAARWRAYARFLAKAPAEALTQRAAGTTLVRQDRPIGGVTSTGDALTRPQDLEQSRDVFERQLPYAVALGVDRTWVQKFATIGTPAPRWLQTPPVIVVGGPTWGGPTWVGPGGVPGAGMGGSVPQLPWRGEAPGEAGDSGSATLPGGLQSGSDNAAGGLERASGGLADLLNTASEVLSRGGGGDWSGGGFGGGSGSSGSGSSGGGGSGFE